MRGHRHLVILSENFSYPVISIVIYLLIYTIMHRLFVSLKTMPFYFHPSSLYRRIYITYELVKNMKESKVKILRLSSNVIITE